MQISIEKTPGQKLDQFVVDTASAISIVHLPHQSLSYVLNASVDINQQAGENKSIPHIAARNVKSTDELDNFIAHCLIEKIDRVLLIGGSKPLGTGHVFQTANELVPIFTAAGVKVYCGIYPLTDDETALSYKFNRYNGGITQLCLNPFLLQRYTNWATIGVPSMCSTSGLWRYMKMCGLRDSIKYIFQNINGIFYLSADGFNTSKFINHVGYDKKFHIYNFGNLTKTIDILFSK